ncbi:MAG TPA: ORF6N domain-containing protein [Thermoleophilia bacterium]|nr:ORF6N domain-containing protein [Thermoleophilia bacterium]
MRFQFGTSSSWGGRRYLPYAFTEQGVAMLSSVLRSRRAVQVNIEIMRAFVRLRETLALHKELATRLADLERQIASHDGGFRLVKALASRRGFWYMDIETKDYSNAQCRQRWNRGSLISVSELSLKERVPWRKSIRCRSSCRHSQRGATRSPVPSCPSL